MFPADLYQIDGEKAEITNGRAASAIMTALEGARFRVASVKTRETRRNAAAPFTTSTLQQEASRKLKFRVRKTMQIAQALYEGVDLGGREGTQGLITYMRTDSTRIADSARDAARDYIVGRFGDEFHGGGRQFKIKEGAQDAHEAIRPTSVAAHARVAGGHPQARRAAAVPADLGAFRRLADGARRSSIRPPSTSRPRTASRSARPAACSSSPATPRSTKRASTTGARRPHRTRRRTRRTARQSAPDPAEARPKASSSTAKSIEPKQHFTEPPPRFTEATLVRALEENGIGRPSTYSAIVETIQARGYVEQLDRRFFPTDIGKAVNDLLAEHFKDIVDLKFTASMEAQLDELAETRRRLAGDGQGARRVLRRVQEASSTRRSAKLPKFEQRDEPTDEVCVNCGKPMVIKTGRFGRFMSCTGYPECKTTKPILKDTGVKCPK